MGDKGHLTAQTKSTLLEHQLKKKKKPSQLLWNPLWCYSTPVCFCCKLNQKLLMVPHPPCSLCTFSLWPKPLFLPLLTGNHVVLRVCSEVGLMRSPLCWAPRRDSHSAFRCYTALPSPSLFFLPPLTHGFITSANNGCSHIDNTTEQKKEDRQKKKLLPFPCFKTKLGSSLFVAGCTWIWNSGRVKNTWWHLCSK